MFNFLLVCLFSAVALTAATLWYLVPRLPDIEALKDVQMQVPLRVYTQELSLIAEFGEKRREPVKLSEVPPLLIKAILAAEDDRFYEHPGADWQGLLRAAIQLVRTGEKTQGGSTITMQVARNFFLTREKSYLRKLNEILLALKIERELSKDAILELYLNKIYLGQRAYGVAAAAQVYYGTDIRSLTLPQIAMIASLPKAPSTTNPITDPARALERRSYVLGRMLELGFITQPEYAAAIAAPQVASLHNPAVEANAPYFAEMVRAYMLKHYGEAAYTSGYRVITTIINRLQTAANWSLRKALLEYDRRHGYRGAERHIELDAHSSEDDWSAHLAGSAPLGDLFPALVVERDEQSAVVYLRDVGPVILDWSSLSWARPYLDENHRGPAPKRAADILNLGDVVRVQLTEEGKWRLVQLPAIEGGLVAMRPDDGALLALIGGFDFQRSKFNRVTQARRQPGSSFKPFIYSAALDSGYTAASLINDAPVIFNDPGLEAVWRPENYSGRTHGPTRLREALTYSRNLVSIRLLNSIGVSKTIAYLDRFGFDVEQLPKNLSLALGSGAATPLQLVTGFAVFANGGYYVEPYFIDRIETYDGRVVMRSEPKKVCHECRSADSTRDAFALSVDTDSGALAVLESGEMDAERVISPQNAWIMDSMMRDVIRRGTGQGARELARDDLSGKTGTTNDQRDAWFSGFNTQIVATAWVGFDQFQPLGDLETGARAALPMWVEFMRTALEGMPPLILERPPGLVEVRIDPETGQLASADNSRAIFETFRIEDVPKNLSGEPIPTTHSDAVGTEDIPEQLF
ncbi:MAG: penicillin-binding protein 1A [Gammaproteobacteria bacterium]|nr:penicillin-binding protein 1A [Gammaproteobacteria bacterium]MCI0591292.1 penicillin-binding protein 1A [Gammaproteobacteria bacterium]